MEDRERIFQQIVDDWSERLYWHIRSFLACHEDTNDVLQDVYMKIWTALPSFRGEAQLFTWVWRIATNESLNFLRKRKIRAAFSLQDYEEVLANRLAADPYFNGDDVQRELTKEIMRLPEKQKAVFCMRYYEDLSYEQISEITGTSVGALKASYHIAYEKLVKLLKDNLV